MFHMIHSPIFAAVASLMLIKNETLVDMGKMKSVEITTKQNGAHALY